MMTRPFRRCRKASFALLCLAGTCGAGLAPAQAAFVVDHDATWVESAVCSVVARAPIDAAKPLLPGNPIDSLTTLPAICTGNIWVRSEVPGGVRSLLLGGWRIQNISHQVTVIRSDDAAGKAELLISGLFVVERTPTRPTGSGR